MSAQPITSRAAVRRPRPIDTERAVLAPIANFGSSRRQSSVVAWGLYVILRSANETLALLVAAPQPAANWRPTQVGRTSPGGWVAKPA